MTIRHKTVGEDRTPVLIVDDVFRNPEAVRTFALGMHYDKPLPGDGWPGVQAAASLDRHELITLIKNHLVRYQLGIEPENYSFPAVRAGDQPDQWSSFFLQTRFGIVNKTPEQAPGVAHPHVDEFGFIASVMYLSDSERSHGGTVLCRHRRTGIQTVPPFAEGLPASLAAHIRATQSYQYIEHLLNLKGRSKITDIVDGAPLLSKEQHETVWDHLMEGSSNAPRYMTESDDHWEIIEQIDMRFNRLVAYPTWQLHGINWDMSVAGTTKAEQRLTMMDWLNYPIPHAA
jgi:hypothetical protein